MVLLSAVWRHHYQFILLPFGIKSHGPSLFGWLASTSGSVAQNGFLINLGSPIHALRVCGIYWGLPEDGCWQSVSSRLTGPSSPLMAAGIVECCGSSCSWLTSQLWVGRRGAWKHKSKNNCSHTAGGTSRLSIGFYWLLSLNYMAIWCLFRQTISGWF